MKTILCLTDFSGSANDAVNYAFGLSGSISANVMLCNAIKIPLLQPVPGGLTLPLEDYGDLLERSKKELEAYADAMAKINKVSGKEYPKVNAKAMVGEIEDLVREIVLSVKINMIVMGMSGAGDMKRFFMGSSTRDMIDATEVPLLLVPKKTRFNPLKKIAFATDLSMNDFEVIRSLSGLAAIFNSELLIIHVIDQASGQDKLMQINSFMAELKTRIRYDKVYYKNVYCKDVEGGLEWINENGQIDCLAMIHRPHGFLNGVLKGSHTQKMARITGLPLLVFPHGYKAAIC